MASTPSTPIIASPNQGSIDLSFATLRYIIVIVTAVPTILGLLKAQDVASLHAYFSSDDGKVVITAVIALGTMLWGLYKTHKRGAQAAAVAVSPRVPSDVARVPLPSTKG